MIIVTGTVAYDYIMEFPGKFGDHILPEKTHNINLSFIVNKFAKRRGGTAGNVSYTLGLLSTPHIIFTIAGKDFEQYKKDFNKVGINTKSIIIDKKNYTSTGFALTDSSNNQIWGYFYGAAENIPKLKLSTVAKKGDFVVIGPQGAAGSLSMIKQCIEQGISYMFDPGFILTQITDENLHIGLSHAAYTIGNDYEIDLIKSRIKDWPQVCKKSIVITTQGEKGANIQDGAKQYHIAPTGVKKVVTTTGAGDAWRGGFLAGLEREYDLQTSGQMGSVAASFALGHYGTQEHFYTKKEFQDMYRQTFGSIIEL